MEKLSKVVYRVVALVAIVVSPSVVWASRLRVL